MYIPEENKPHKPPKPAADAELDALKAEYREKNAAMDAAIAHYEELIHEIEGTARETTSQAILEAIGTPASEQATDLFAALRNINIDTTELAKQGTNPLATNTAILEALTGGDDPDIPEGVAERLAIIMQFFGLPEALPEIQLATEAEVKGINDDVMGALYGYGKVTVTIHSLMRTGAETTQDLASVIYVDPEKTWAENGFQTLYDDEGTAIDTTTNPAAGDEVYNYLIQSES